MPTISQPRDLFLNELKAMLYVEQRLADDVLPDLSKEIKAEEFREDVRHHIEETRRHVANLERAFELLGEEPKPDKSHAVDGLVAQHDKVAKTIESGDLLDLFDASAAAKTEHLEIAAYESLITSAVALGETEIVSLLEENLDDEKAALEKVENASREIASESAVA